MSSSKKVTSALSHAVRSEVSNVRRWTRGVASSCCATSVSAGTSSCSRQLPESSISSVSAVGRLQCNSPRPCCASVMPCTGHPFYEGTSDYADDFEQAHRASPHTGSTHVRCGLFNDRATVTAAVPRPPAASIPIWPAALRRRHVRSQSSRIVARSRWAWTTRGDVFPTPSWLSICALCALGMPRDHLLRIPEAGRAPLTPTRSARWPC